MRFIGFIILLCLMFWLVFPTGCKRHEHLESKSAKAEQEEMERIREILQKRRSKDPKPLHRRTDQTPHEVLERMISVYKNAKSYSDHGLVRIIGTFVPSNVEPAPLPCIVAYEAPGKLRLEINDGMLTSNGNDTAARIRALPNQVLGFSTPEKWSLETIFQDLYLDRAMELGIPKTILRFPPQLVLLFAADPLRTFVPEGSVVEFLDPQWIRETPCDLIRISHPSGNRVLWIGRLNSILYRFDYLVEGLSVPKGIENIASIRIELTDAEIDREIRPEAFQMMHSDGIRRVAEFQSIEDQLLGKTLKEAESLRQTTVLFQDGSEKTLEQAFTLNHPDLKVLLLCFLSPWEENSRDALSELRQLHKIFAEDNRVCCLVIHLDPRYAADKKQESRKYDDSLFSWRTVIMDEASQRIVGTQDPTIEQEGAPIVCTDLSGNLSERFSIDTVPTWIVITPDGVTEGYYRGLVPETQLSSLIREILSGGKPYEKSVGELKRLRNEHRRMIDQLKSNGVYYEKTEKSDSLNRQRAAYPKTPKTFSLEERWVMRDLVSPGNIGLFQEISLHNDMKKQPILLLPCDGDSLALIDIEGELIKKIKPEGLMRDEMLMTVRIGIDGIGKQYIGVSSVSGHSVHVYDELFSRVFSYRANEIKHEESAVAVSGFGLQHSVSKGSSGRVIADFRFADVYGNGTQSLLLGVLGLNFSGNTFHDSILAVDFFGKEIWRDDTVESPFAIDSYVDDGKRGVYALTFPNRRGTLLKLDEQGKRIKPLYFTEDQHVVAFSVNDLDGDGQSELAVILSNRDDTKYRFAVLDHEGNIIGQNPVPFGELQKGIDPIIAGDLVGDSCKEWIVTSPDGMIHVFDRMGKKVDSFAFGEYLNGLVTVTLFGNRLLIVVEEDQLTAWEIVPLEKHTAQRY